MFWKRRRSDADFNEEIESHIEIETEQLISEGFPAPEARTAARRRFGNVAALQERFHGSQRPVPWLDDFARDVRHALRSMWRTPVFTVVALLTLALGIGANTAIFSIVNGVLLRPLHYPRPAQLIYLTTNGTPQFPVSVAEYLEFQQFNSSLTDVGAFRTGEANLNAGDRALRVRSAIVDVHLLNALGVQPVEGRLFTMEDSVVSAPAFPGGIGVPAPVVMISYELWQSVYGARPIVGNIIDVDGRRLQVVGIMERGADLMDKNTDLWLPLGFTDRERLARNNHNLTLIGRLREGVTLTSAQTELNALIEGWSGRTGITPGGGHAGHVFLPPTQHAGGHFLRMTPLADQILGGAGRSIWVLQAAVGLVLLIACANVANLLLAHAETRQREFALLTALGAGRGRLLRKVITESVILSIAGGGLGVLLAGLGLGALVRAYPASLPKSGDVTVDLQVMLLSFAIAVLCGLLFGLAPMRHTRLGATTEALKAGGRASASTTRHHLRRTLVIAETTLAVIIVVGAGLLLRTVRNLTAVDVGFDRARLVTFSVTLPPASFDLLARVHSYQRLMDQLRGVPGIQMATAMTSLPLDRPFLFNQTEIANSTVPSGSTAPIDYQRVMSGFFETIGIPILEGRGFESTDVGSGGRVAVVNETLANTYWKGRNPIGQQLRPGGTTPWFTVIGVARDVKQTGVDQPVGAEAYVFVDQLATDSPTLSPSRRQRCTSS
jgi:putative ABC transport system permease protein